MLVNNFPFYRDNLKKSLEQVFYSFCLIFDILIS
jgi:hypothetical protein